MTVDNETKQADEMPLVRIPPVELDHGKLGLGCWVFGGKHWAGQDENDSRAVMEAALRRGMNHFDTAEDYGDGKSETMIGEFLSRDYHRRDGMFIATKGLAMEPTGEAITTLLERSLSRLGVECVDLYYVHYPLRDRDMRPIFEALEQAREQGKLRAIGVSNFTVAQMTQAAQVCTIRGHQLCYNALWRFAEDEVIPYCRENKIAVVTYSSIAQGILTGKFPLQPHFAEGDLRAETVHFEPAVWPHVHAAVEKLKALAKEAGRPLAHLAIRWVARNPDITSVLVGARNTVQLNELAGAMTGKIDDAILDRMTAISDELRPHIPDTGNIFRYYP